MGSQRVGHCWAAFTFTFHFQDCSKARGLRGCRQSELGNEAGVWTGWGNADKGELRGHGVLAARARSHLSLPSFRHRQCSSVHTEFMTYERKGWMNSYTPWMYTHMCTHTEIMGGAYTLEHRIIVGQNSPLLFVLVNSCLRWILLCFLCSDPLISKTLTLKLCFLGNPSKGR